MARPGCIAAWPHYHQRLDVTQSATAPDSAVPSSEAIMAPRLEKVMIRFGAFTLAAAMLGGAGLALASSPKGVEVGDIDRKVDPCADFYGYANGAWRAANPIPPSMERWSRRWAAGEQNKEQLKALLQDLSGRPDWPKSSAEQQIGDFQTSCMDEKSVNRSGITPILPLIEAIDAMRTPADLNRMIGRLQDLAIPAPFGLYSSPDNHQPERVIAYVAAG